MATGEVLEQGLKDLDRLGHERAREIERRLDALCQEGARDPMNRIALARARELMARLGAVSAGGVSGVKRFQRLIDDWQVAADRHRDTLDSARRAIEQEAYGQALAMLQTSPAVTPGWSRSVQILQELDRRRARFQASLLEAVTALDAGRARHALALLGPCLDDFPTREVGQLVVSAVILERQQRLMLEALLAERSGDLELASSSLEDRVLSLEQARILLARVRWRQNDLEAARKALGEVSTDLGKYWQGFLAQACGDLPGAIEAWEGLTVPGVAEQLQIVKGRHERDRLRAKAAIQDAFQRDHVGEAASRSRQFLRRFGVDELVQWNLTKHLVPRQARDVHLGTSLESRVEASRRAIRETLDARHLRAWFAAEMDLFRHGGADPRGLLASWHMILANWSRLATPEFAPVDHDEALKREFSAGLDRLASAVPRHEDHHRLDRLARELSGDGAGFHLSGFLITPGAALEVLSLDGAQWIGPPGHEEDLTLQALYGAWAFTALELAARNLDMARVHLPDEVDTAIAHEVFIFTDLRVREILRDWKDSGFDLVVDELLELGPEVRELARWRDTLEECFQEEYAARNDLDDEEQTVDVWTHLLGTLKARLAAANVRTRRIASDLSDEEITRDEAITRLEALIRETPEFKESTDLRNELVFRRHLEDLVTSLSGHDVLAAISRARLAPEPMRQRLARALVDMGLRALDMKQTMGAKMFVTVAHQVHPHVTDLREVYRAFDV
jgi:hypothetical protein